MKPSMFIDDMLVRFGSLSHEKPDLTAAFYYAVFDNQALLDLIQEFNKVFIAHFIFIHIEGFNSNLSAPIDSISRVYLKLSPRDQKHGRAVFAHNGGWEGLQGIR